MTVALVRHEVGEARPYVNGLCGNPPRPVEVYRCDRHGEFLRRHVWNDTKCRDCDREARARINSNRQPPAPPYRGQAGRCSLCGTTELPPRRRSWCSDDCVTMWNVASAGQAALAHLRAVHGSFCHCCGDPVSYLEVDHWRPLWSLTDEMRTELRWWLPFNLRLLCQSCHRGKTRHEAAVRAAVRRGDSEWTQWPGPGAEPPPPPRGARAAAAGQLRLV